MEELIRRFKEGDISAFDELIISLQSDLYKIARMRLSCQDDINDAERLQSMVFYHIVTFHCPTYVH